MHRFLDAANAVTIASLVASLACATLAINGHTGLALIMLMISGLCDLFDGLVARRLTRDDQQREFGGRLDSLVDGCAFGFAPSVMLYCAGMSGPVEILLLAALPICVVWRVAYFEVVGLQTDPPKAGPDGDEQNASLSPRYYTGLPATYVALVLPLAATLGFAGETWFRWGVGSTVLLLSVAMVSTVRFRKPGGLAYAGFLLLAIVMTFVLSVYGGLLPSLAR